MRYLILLWSTVGSLNRCVLQAQKQALSKHVLGEAKKRIYDPETAKEGVVEPGRSRKNGARSLDALSVDVSAAPRGSTLPKLPTLAENSVTAEGSKPARWGILLNASITTYTTRNTVIGI
jgi:hypothetical protein